MALHLDNMALSMEQESWHEMQKKRKARRAFRHGLAIASAMAVGLTFSASASAGEKEDKDRATCASMGAPYGTTAYTECMLQQQQRGDQKMLNFLAEQRMHQELGRPAREQLERKRARREREEWCR